ncbi:MAG TPA: glycosyltransferase family 39 protein, partial [Rhodanobacteraceae bacterium]|nr:glycosyltransferase family 39 protein [Rhodanobacteraceae bacterium]
MLAQSRRELLWFALIALVVLGAGIGLRDPWPADEPRFALSAKQMVDSGNWLIPHRGSELYSDKPPTFMALQAATWEIVRDWRIAFLLPSLLAALATLLLVYDLARRLWDHRTGLYAAAALLAAFQFVYQAKRAQIDPTVTFFIT